MSVGSGGDVAEQDVQLATSRGHGLAGGSVELPSKNSRSYTLRGDILSGMFGNLLKVFMRTKSDPLRSTLVRMVQNHVAIKQTNKF